MTCLSPAISSLVKTSFLADFWTLAKTKTKTKLSVISSLVQTSSSFLTDIWTLAKRETKLSAISSLIKTSKAFLPDFWTLASARLLKWEAAWEVGNLFYF